MNTNNRTNKKGYSFRFDPDMIEGIDAIAKETNRNRTQVLSDLMSDLLSTNPVPNESISQTLDRTV